MKAHMRMRPKMVETRMEGNANLATKLTKFSADWSPRTVALIKNLHVVVVKSIGEYVCFTRMALVRRELSHVTEICSILQCNGLTGDQILEWFERRYQIGKFAK